MPIQVEHLTHTYMPGSPFSAVALNDVSLTIEDGELIGLLGHTGSGKTTLVQHLNGLIKPTSGRVVVDGLDLTQKGVSLLEVRKKVGLVFQYPEYQLFEETVAKDIAFGPRNMGLDAEEIDRRVRGAMQQVGLNYDEVAERSPFELSGGQMRRVAIAGVLAMRPRVLILDDHRVLIAHGHTLGVKTGLLRAQYRALEMNADILLFGHTHVPLVDAASRPMMMNPGSIGDPRRPTYGVLEFRDGQIYPSVFRLDA